MGEILKEEYSAELENMNEMILRKYALGELEGVQALHRMLKRSNDIAYFLGRLDGEKYKEDSNV
ncbi:hypothetical protein GCM10007111_08570 [Virgibacillus kapii]|uniref:Uncharacterized protein n=1 Tax=Virgibacillus kapii TaxID=1638645 RepID=A0ABQ2D7I5_9BACI|nr:hypothetical protein GCM10007111_08570 [Virgibacillus kapii]